MFELGFSVIIVAAGRGRRAGMEGAPKQFCHLADGETVLGHTCKRFIPLLEAGSVNEIILVHHPDDRVHLAPLKALHSDHLIFVEGGESRCASVRKGLDVVRFDKVLIHDGVRPFASPALIGRVMKALERAPGAAPGLGVTDALWRARGEQAGARWVEHIIPRTQVYRAQTPQGFHTHRLIAAYKQNKNGVDDVEIARAGGIDIVIVEGEKTNMKITYKTDFEEAREICRRLLP